METETDCLLEMFTEKMVQVKNTTAYTFVEVNSENKKK